MLSNNNMGQSFHTGAFANHSEEESVWGHSDIRYAFLVIYHIFSINLAVDNLISRMWHYRRRRPVCN